MKPTGTRGIAIPGRTVPCLVAVVILALGAAPLGVGGDEGEGAAVAPIGAAAATGGIEADPWAESSNHLSGAAHLPTARSVDDVGAGHPPLADAAHADPQALQALRAEISRHLAQGAGRTGDWGLIAVSGSLGDTLFAHNHDASLAPASNQKLFTSAAALYHLGPDFRFATFLLADGPLEDGAIRGNLILYGTGDPAISDRLLESEVAPFRRFARELRSQGVHTIEGSVLGDGTFFNGPTRRDSWNPRDLNDWFAAPISALSFNENVVTLQVQAAAPGHSPRIRTQPEGALLHLSNQGRTVSGGARTPLMIVRDHPDDPIELRGEMAPGQPDIWRRITVSDPPSFAASVLKRVLREEGIRVTGSSGSVRDRSESRVTGAGVVAPAFQVSVQDRSAANGHRPSADNHGPSADRTWTVAVHRSPPVRDLLEVVNKRSHNLYADALLMSVGRAAWGDGSFDGGSQALTRYLTEVVRADPATLHVVDGSGLSRLNRASPASLVQLLAHMEHDRHAEAFWASLPEAGNQRELRRMYRSPAAGNLRAKTGTIHRVSALSGVVRSTAGEPIYFSIVANDVPSPWAAKQVEDRIGIQLAGFTRPFDPRTAPLLRRAEGAGETATGSAVVQQDQE